VSPTGPCKPLHSVSLKVSEGEIVTVIGPNGAGRTTPLCAGVGLMPSSGTLTLSGRTIARPSVEAMVAGGVALVPEKRELFGQISIEDNLLLGSAALTVKA
jgi:branched-chain amino acid transport system ATP-binding protein